MASVCAGVSREIHPCGIKPKFKRANLWEVEEPYPSEEIWGNIPGFSGYQASNRGRIRNARGRVLKQRRASNGALMVSIGKANPMVHGLVLLTFRGQKPDGTRPRHRNRNLTDNRLSNLHYAPRGGDPQRLGTKCSKGHDLAGNNVKTWGANRICLACQRGDKAPVDLPEVL